MRDGKRAAPVAGRTGRYSQDWCMTRS
jgi:hypothetical protein